ncbi:versager [Musca autumnalis]|uniref:versager n=1 Tax=Musca autumnalis TaxID=221902 RepID=UPI003CF8DD54
MSVPKKVNRHVLKALNALSNGNINKPISQTAVVLQVEYQMRNLVPVPNLETMIEHSLNDLSEVGLIEKRGRSKFAIGHSYGMTPPASRRPLPQLHREYFQPRVARKRSAQNLDPNSNVNRHNSQESISGNEYDRARKRLRTNNRKFIFGGGMVPLPKSKNHRRHYDNEIGYLSDGAVEDLNLRIYTEWLHRSPLLVMPTNGLQMQCEVGQGRPSLEISEIQNPSTTSLRGKDHQDQTSEIKLLNEQKELHREDKDGPSTSSNLNDEQKLPSRLQISKDQMLASAQEDTKSKEEIARNSSTATSNKASQKSMATKKEMKVQEGEQFDLTCVEDVTTILAPKPLSYLN